jgi:hypothetical protein
MSIGGAGPEGAPHKFTPDELEWVGAHLTDLRRSYAEKRVLRWTLITGFVIGLVAYLGGYLVRSAAAEAEPLALLGDLLYTLGWALWTGVVVTLLLQIFPEWKQRQLERYLRAYEQAVRDQSRVARDTAPQEK